MPGDIIILHKCTVNDNHMVPDMWKATGNNFLPFWHIFCLLPHLTTQIIKTLKKWKKTWRYHNFTSLTKIIIIFYIYIYIHKKQTLAVLGILVKQCNNILCVIWLDRKYCRWNCATARLKSIHQIHLHREFCKTI